MNADRLDLIDLKERMPIPEIWRLLNLPGNCERQPCRTPWRDDRRPSLSIYAQGRRFKDHATGQRGDVIDFLGAVTGLDVREATRRFIELAGGCGHSEFTPRPVPEARTAERTKPVLPSNLHVGTEHELQRVADLRGLSIEAARLASERGLLFFGQVCRGASWIITDVTRHCAQARRLDGAPYPAFGELAARKAHTIKGSWQKWPIGAQESLNSPFIALNEGGPDLLACCHLILAEARVSDMAPVAILGAHNDIHDQALPLLAGKRVRIFPHVDDAGQAASVRWTAQLEGMGCTVDAFRLDGLWRVDGDKVSDLNDLIRISAECFEAERAELEEVLPG